jgi:HEAT repeat protein
MVESSFPNHVSRGKEHLMSERSSLIAALVMVALLLAGALPAAVADEALDKGFEALKTYDWGSDRGPLGAIEQAVIASHDDAAAQKALETRLAEVLKTDVSRAAKDLVCRQLSLIGSAASVPTLAALLPDKELSHMGRYALERMPCPEAVAAMRDALAKTSGQVKVGVINSLGVRRDAQSVSVLVGLLGDSDQQVAAAAAAALGSIGNAQAAQALTAFQKKAPAALQLAVADACLACAEQLLADGNKAGAIALYKSLSGEEQPKHVRLAATRGLLAAAGK